METIGEVGSKAEDSENWQLGINICSSAGADHAGVAAECLLLALLLLENTVRQWYRIAEGMQGTQKKGRDSDSDKGLANPDLIR